MLNSERQYLELRAALKAKFNEDCFLDTQGDPLRNSWHHLRWFDLIELHQYLLIKAAREHAKTEIGVKTNSLFEMAVDTNVRILIVSDIHEKAQDRTRLLRDHIERNEEYKRKYPHVRIAKKEGDHAFTLARRKILKEPTVTSTYAGGPIAGGRFDRIVCDDLVNLLRNSYTPQQRKKLRDWFYRDVMNSLTTGGKLLMLGTPQHHDDLHSDIEKDHRFHVVTYPGVDEEDTGFGHLGYSLENEKHGVYGDDAICLWPAMHSYSEHMARKEGDFDTYLSQQQLQSVPPTGLVYRRPLVEAAFERGKEVEYDPHAPQFIGLDPGYGQRAAMLCIQEKTGDRVELWREHSFTQMPDEKVSDTVIEHAIEFGLEALFVDAEDPGLAGKIRNDRDAAGLVFAVVPVPFNKFKRNSIKATRWLLTSGRIAWRGDRTIVHKPGRTTSEPSLFYEETRDYALKEGEDDVPMKGDDHGPDAWTAYASKHVKHWVKATNQQAA